jgi:transposase-like protein
MAARSPKDAKTREELPALVFGVTPRREGGFVTWLATDAKSSYLTPEALAWAQQQVAEGNTRTSGIELLAFVEAQKLGLSNPAALPKWAQQYYREHNRFPSTDELVAYHQSLQKGQPPIINDSDNEKDPVQQFENPLSGAKEELAAIQQRSGELAIASQIVASLGLEDADTQIQITGLHEIATRCEQLARNIGITAISEGKMSQVQLARLLGVAPLTVNRWVKTAQEQQNKPEQEDQ